MGLRLRRTIKVFPGLTLNLSKSGVSASVGIRGAKVTVGSKGIRKTVGIPGSGLSYTDYQKYGGAPDEGSPRRAADTSTLPLGTIAVVAFILLVLYLCR